jgi:hypothetical protein
LEFEKDKHIRGIFWLIMKKYIICEVCTKSIELLFDGYPLYYFGARPDEPWNAKQYFCGPICTTEYYNKEKNNGNV